MSRNAAFARARSGSSIAVVCPRCHSRLRLLTEGATCENCGGEFGWVDGRLDLIVGERYDDSTPETVLRDEEVANGATTERYWVPLFKKLFPRQPQTVRVLSVGCGVGTDVEVLCSAGFDAVGIDCGKRSSFWNRRHDPSRYISANAGNLPFADGTFDCLFSGCLFPHVGVQGTTYDVTPGYLTERLKLAHEMSRVLKPGGKIVCCNPNRYFPCDIFHGHAAGKFSARPTAPWDPLLLSIRDYAHLFRDGGCTRIEAMPVENYWAFTGSNKSRRGRLLSAPVRFLFWLVSRKTFRFLRSSFLNPWLIVMVEKTRTA